MAIDKASLTSENKSSNTNQLILEWHIVVSEKESTAIAILDQYSQAQGVVLSKAQLKQAIAKGALWLTPAKNKKQTQRLRRVKKTLVVGDELHFYYNSQVLTTTVPQAILIKDLVDYSVWYKPYGMLSQGSKWSDHCTIARFAQQNLANERPAFIVHRLDRAATGLIIIAHSKKAARALADMFEHHRLEKYYHIIVHGNHNTRPQPDIISSDVDGKAARSTFTCLAYDNVTQRSLVKVKIDTGRKHQIRVHAASISMPVVGDRLHGLADNTEQDNLQLCAVSLRFTCPLLSSAAKGNNDEVKGDSTLAEQERFFELPETIKPQLC